MINFGVREVASSKGSVAPGWAYVPESAANSSVAALQPRKRARNAPSGTTLHETTAKQDAKILRELAALDRENHRDVNIPVPIRGRDGAGRVSHGKVTPSVKKILQSQKTFVNHLSDFEAHIAIAGSAPTPLPTPPAAPSTPRAPPGSTLTNLTSTGKRSHKKKVPVVAGTSAAATPLRRAISAAQLAAPVVSPKLEPKDIYMPDAPILAQGNCKVPEPHPGDADPLLVSRIPPMPSLEEIEKLLRQPPLTYAEARGPWVEEDRRKPVRVFCEVCGYWGRVKCTRCGGRVCALECLGVHQEECFTRYGA